MKKIFSLDFIETTARQKSSVMKAVNAVATFYFFQIALAFINLMKIGAVDPERSGFLPIWPMSWAGSLSYSFTAQILAVLYAASAFAAVFFWRKWFVRLLVFLAFWQVHALDSSFGYINHFYYLIFYALFIFIFLPDTKEDTDLDHDQAKKFLLVFWGVIAAVFVTYTLSGFWKIYWGILALLDGRLSSFSMMAFPEHVARKTIFESREYFYSNLVISNPILAWISYLGTIYVEFAALWVAFKPNLHKVWAFVFLFMHVGILLVIGIPFFESITVLCLIVLNSPFSGKVNLVEIFSDLPFFGFVFKKIFKIVFRHTS